MAEIELNFFEYSNSKKYLATPDIVEYNKINKPQYDIILGVKTMKENGIILDFKDNMITIDEVKLPMRNINYNGLIALEIKCYRRRFVNSWGTVLIFGSW